MYRYMTERNGNYFNQQTARHGNCGGGGNHSGCSFKDWFDAFMADRERLLKLTEEKATFEAQLECAIATCKFETQVAVWECRYAALEEQFAVYKKQAEIDLANCQEAADAAAKDAATELKECQDAAALLQAEIDHLRAELCECRRREHSCQIFDASHPGVCADVPPPASN